MQFDRDRARALDVDDRHRRRRDSRRVRRDARHAVPDARTGLKDVQVIYPQSDQIDSRRSRRSRFARASGSIVNVGDVTTIVRAPAPPLDHAHQPSERRLRRSRTSPAAQALSNVQRDFERRLAALNLPKRRDRRAGGRRQSRVRARHGRRHEHLARALGAARVPADGRAVQRLSHAVCRDVQRTGGRGRRARRARAHAPDAQSLFVHRLGAA